MNIGIIKWFNSERGYGVISTLTDNSNKAIDVFLHINNWNEVSDTITPIVLGFSMDKHKNRYVAKKCRFFDYSSKEDWKELLSYERKGLKVYRESCYKDIPYSILECCLKGLKEPSDLKELDAFISEKLSETTIESPKDLLWLLNMKKYSSNETFISLIDELIATLPFNIRKGLLFPSNKTVSFGLSDRMVSLRNFSTQECLEMVDNIKYDDIKRLCPDQEDKAFCIIRKKISSISHPYRKVEAENIARYLVIGIGV